MILGLILLVVAVEALVLVLPTVVSQRTGDWERFILAFVVGLLVAGIVINATEVVLGVIDSAG